jgi:ABC-type dipeptide/oligopeptide/nickel transport system ATPase component
MLITHDLGVVAELADDVVVMYCRPDRRGGAGRAIFASPQHPYTKALLGALPRSTRRTCARRG